MDDGIYVIRRSRQAYSAEKSLVVSAYNDQNVHMTEYVISDHCPKFCISSIAYWQNSATALQAHQYVQENQMMYLQPYDFTAIDVVEFTWYVKRICEDGACLFSFPATALSGIITNVSLWHYSMGKCKTKLVIGGKTYYGSISKTTKIFDWENTDYSLRPDGANWKWADIAALRAGMHLYNLSDPEHDSTDYGRFRYGNGILRHFKLVVSYTDSSGVARTIDIWPSGTVSSNCIPVMACPIWMSNISKNWKSAGAHDFPLLSSVTGFAYAGVNPVMDRTYESDLSEVPPPFSKINSVTLKIEYKDYTEVGGNARLFLRVGGKKYYDSAQAFGADLATMKTRTRTWTVSPATGKAWTYEEAQGLRFGVDYHCNGTVGSKVRTHFTQMYIYAFNCTTKYQELPEAVEYIKINYDSIDYLKRVKKLPIVPDELQFSGPFLSPLTELVLYVSGIPKFQGLVWRCSEINSSGHYKIYAKSREVLLNYRYIPSFFYDSKNWTFEKIYTIADLLSDDRPTYPNFRCMGKAMNSFGKTYQMEGTSIIWVYYEGITCDYIHQAETAVGLMYLINSYVPELPNSAGKIEGLDLTGRAIMTMNHSPQASPSDYFTSDDISKQWSMANAITFTLRQGSDEDYYGAVRRLHFVASTAHQNGQYYTNGQDSYISDDCWPGTLLLMADHIFDTYIRPEVKGFDKKYISIPFNYGGMASSVLENIFQKIGAELQFPPQLDGTVKMLVADEVGRGSADAPIASFVDGVNCKIKPSTSQNPPPGHIVGNSLVPGISSDFALSKGVPIVRVVQDSSKTGDEMQEYLDALRPQTNDYQITCYRGEWLLDPYDWIAVTKDGVTESVRISDMSISEGVTTIKAGSHSSAQEKFLEWKALRDDLDDVYQYGVVKFESETPAASTSFTVDADRIAEDDWRCVLGVSWSTKSPEIVISGDSVMKGHLSASGRFTGADAMTVKLFTPANSLYIQWSNEGSTETGRIYYKAYTNETPTSVTLRGLTITTDNSDTGISGSGVSHTAYVTAYPVKSYSVSPDMMFLKVTLNGKVIPPGRMNIMDFSGSKQIDISAHCIAGTNTLSLAIVNGVAKTATNSGQAISGKVAQTRRLTVIQNA